jgi:hypothetical protein
MNLDMIPLAPGWVWHEWSNPQWGVSTRWLHNETMGIFRCTDCGYECAHSSSIAGHNASHADCGSVHEMRPRLIHHTDGPARYHSRGSGL